MQNSYFEKEELAARKKTGQSNNSIDLRQNTRYDDSALLDDIRNILRTSYLPDYEETKLKIPDISAPYIKNLSATLTVTVTYPSLTSAREYFEKLPDEIYRILKFKLHEFFTRKIAASLILVFRIQLKDINLIIDLQLDAAYITDLDPLIKNELNVLPDDLSFRLSKSEFKSKKRLVFKCINDRFNFVNAYNQ